MTNRLAAGGLLVLAVLLGGCSEASKDAGGEPASATRAPLPQDVVADLPRLDKPVKANRLFALTGCTLGPGPVLANGTLSSFTTPRHDYVVSVTWLSGRDRLARSTAIVKELGPKRSATLEVRAALSRKATECRAQVRFGKLRP